MGATYTRQSSYSDGDTITAAHTNDEFNQLLAAFAASTGHTHDGTTAEGGPITKLLGTAITIGDGTAGADIAVTFDGETSDGVLTWKEDEDYFEFSDDILVASTEKLQFRDTAIYINSSTDGQLDLVADTEIQLAATTVDLNGNLDVSGSITLGGTTITSTASELNILDGVTSTAAELNILDGVTATASELNILDGVTSTTAELNILDGVTSTTAELNILDGVTATTAELNILDGVTSTASELNLVDGITAGTVSASKAVIADSNKDISGFRNLSITGDLTVSGDDITMGTNTAGNLLVADGTNFNSIAVGDLSEISTVANDDVFLAVDTSGGGLKKITRSAIVSGLATSSAISNISEDTTPQLGGDLDVNGNDIVSVSNGNISILPNGSGKVIMDGNGSSGGVSVSDGVIDIRTGTGSVAKILFYCESSNAHAQTLQAQPHSAGVTNVLTLPGGGDQEIVGTTDTQTLTNKTLTSPVISTVTGSTITLDSAGDITLDADGADVVLKDGGTTFGSITNSSGELVIKSGSTPTTAMTFSGANVTFAGTVTIGSAGISEAELEILDGATVTTDELNILDGVTSTASELNLVDGSSAGTIVNSKAVIYGSSGEVNATTLQIAGTSITSTAAELNILDGVTSTTAELNILDGVTSTTAELNILDGVTSTTAELNILDGVTSTATELNVMDGDTSASSITLADADRLVTNDDGTMKQVALTTLKTYLTSAGFTTDDPTALAIALG